MINNFYKVLSKRHEIKKKLMKSLMFDKRRQTATFLMQVSTSSSQPRATPDPVEGSADVPEPAARVPALGSANARDGVVNFTWAGTCRPFAFVNKYRASSPARISRVGAKNLKVSIGK